MKSKSSFDPLRDTSLILKIIFPLIVFLIFFVIFYYIPPMGIDWHFTFFQVAQDPFHPYEIKYFINPPWAALILSPFSFFSEQIGLAINASLGLLVMGILIIQRGGGKFALLLSLTSFPVLTAVADGTIDWIPAIGFLLQNQWGLPFLLIKPQSGVLAFLAWTTSIKQTVKIILPTIITIILSFFVWGNWPLKIWENMQAMKISQSGLSSWDISPFPWAIPVGLAIIYMMIRFRPKESELLGILATFCIFPYMAVCSLAVPFVLLSVSKRNLAIILWFLLWIYAFWRNWEIFLKIIHMQ
jgi:hypothetical protein